MKLLHGDLRIKSFGPRFFLGSCLVHHTVDLFRPGPMKPDEPQDRAAGLGDVVHMANYDEVVFGSEARDLMLEDDRIVPTTEARVRSRILALLADRIRELAGPSARVVELGSTGGRNLFYLARELPALTYVGLEFNARATERSNANAVALGLSNVHFMTVDPSRRDEAFPAGDLGFTVHALEFTSVGASRSVVRRLRAAMTRAILLYEPVVELYPYDVRGITSRLRALRTHRLHGLLPFVDQEFGQAGVRRRLGHGVDPLSETCELVAYCR